MTTPPDQIRLSPLPALIFSSRWLQLPLYLGLIVAQCVYVYLFVKELVHLVTDANTLTEQGIMLLVLGLIDVVMISNLLVMVIVGGYETFVSRLRLQGHPDQPEWLSHVNASVLKVKLAMAIIGISSIHLLKSFIEAGELGLPLCTAALEAAGLQFTYVYTDISPAFLRHLSTSSLSRKHLREAYFAEGVIRVAKRMEHKDKPTKFDMYESYEEPVAKVPGEEKTEGLLSGGGNFNDFKIDVNA